MLPSGARASAPFSEPAERDWETVGLAKKVKKNCRPKQFGYSGRSVTGHPPCATRFVSFRGAGGAQGIDSRLPRSQGATASVYETRRLRNKEAKEGVVFRPLSAPPRYLTPLVDIGANLVGGKRSLDCSAAIDDAVRSGVGCIMITSTSIKVSGMVANKVQAVLNQKVSVGLGGACQELASCALYYTAGCHPHSARFYDKDGGVQALRALLLNDDSGRCVAIGECGLDYHYEQFSNKQKQQAVFLDQLALAVELGKPLFLHEREAYFDFVAMLSSYITRLPAPEMACVHCFTGDYDQLRKYLDLGCSIGITGWVAGKRNGDLVDALRRVGWEALRDRLMIETDAPYLRPYLVMPTREQSSSAKSQSQKKPINVPANLPYVCHALGVVFGVSGEEVAAATTANAKRIFGLDV